MRNTMLTTAVLFGLTALSALAETQTIPNKTPSSPNTTLSDTQQAEAALASVDQRPATIALKTRLAAVIAALRSNDFGTARSELATFDVEWAASIEHDIEARLAPEYARFEEAEEALNTNLVNSAAPDQTKSINAVLAIMDLLDHYLAVLPG